MATGGSEAPPGDNNNNNYKKSCGMNTKTPSIQSTRSKTMLKLRK